MGKINCLHTSLQKMCICNVVDSLSTHFYRIFQGSTACLDLWKLKTKQCPPLAPHSLPLEASSSSLAGFPPNRPPTNHLPDTPPRELEPICCWMRQQVCWRTGAVTDPGDEFWRCPSLEWRCGTLLVQRRTVQGPP